MEQLKILHRSRGRVKSALTRIEQTIKQRENLSYARVKAILNEIDVQAAACEKILVQIETEAAKESPEIQEKEYKDGEALWVRISELRCEAHVALTELQPNNSQDVPNVSTNDSANSLEEIMKRVFTQQEQTLQASRTKLPQLDLMTFSGNYTDWQGFKDMFEVTIHNNKSLSNVEKLQYLRSSLKGDAVSEIKNMATTSDNYETAWNKLKEQFDKKPQIATAHIERFLKQQPVKEAKISLIKQSYNVYKDSIEALEKMGEGYSGKDVWLVHLMQSSMDSETRRLWSQEVKRGDVPSIAKWFDFLRRRMDSLEVYGGTQESQASKENKGSYSKKDRNDGTIKAHHTEEAKCLKCSQAHLLFQCEKFAKLSVENKRSFVADKNVCFNCLKEGHRAKDCRSKGRCQKCHKRHNTLLHEETSSSNSTTSPAVDTHKKISDSEAESTKKDAPKDTPVSVHHVASTTKMILLPTALVNVEDASGDQQTCRVLIDQGSECTLISEACAQRLNLRRHNARLAIKGTGQANVGYTKGAIDLNVSSRYDKHQKIAVKAYILDKLTSKLPGRTITLDEMKHIEGLTLADPQFNHPAKIDIILGMEYAWEINLPDKRSAPGYPIAQLTIFGWVLGGVVTQNAEETSVQVLHTHCDIENSLKRFWEAEEELPERKILTKEEQLCEDDFVATHMRDDSGRFTVKLCFKTDRGKFGNSLPAAQARLSVMERKFKKYPEFHKQYADFMDEYISLGHMEEVPEDERIKEESYIIPHQAVVRPSSTTTKLRVVFDASSKSSSGVSLNDALAIGPQVQDDLLSIMMRFRTYKIAFQADVEKMYRQVQIAAEDQDFQRVLWRSNPQEPMKLYRLKTVTYGTASAPYLATRTLQQMAIDSKETYPEASAGIESGFYMDDLLYGTETVQESVCVSDQIKNILQGGGFMLRKWTSNAEEVLQTKAQDELATVGQDEETGVATLGMRWLPTEDVMKLELHLPQEVRTRRAFLSEAAKVYDPMGIIAPVTITFKMLFQKVWTTTKNWDDDLSEEDQKEYDVIRKEFELLKSAHVERCLPHNGAFVELHAFADASEKAFGVVIYARMLIHGDYHVCLFIAKSKVAPLKPTSIPRMELKAALLLSEVVKKIKDSFIHLEVNVTAWSDSTTVLQWLQSHPRKWQKYVAQRTAQILEVLPPHHWRYVPSKQNPADCLSRGVKPSELVSHPLWWTGPKWLSQDSSAWPENKVVVPADTGEEKIVKKMLAHTTRKCKFSLYEFLQDMSSFSKMVSIGAHLIRLSTKKEERQKGPLTVQERRNSLKRLIRDIQEECFSEEISRCRQGEPVPKGSRLVKLVPFLDDDQILRVRGRLRFANLMYDARHPIILPGGHRFTELLIEYSHKIHLHAGFNLLTSILRSEYWIVGGRNATRKVLNKCIRCFQHRPTLQSPVMANLPAVRVNQIRPFVNTGCDYAGPFEIKASNLRNSRYVKGYICLFICMTTKAVHLEAVGDLSSDGFINALKRFVARRGYCQNIYCDNGRNFVGASAATKDDEVRMRGKVSRIMAQSNIQFHFNPPYAPTFGGLWERAIGSTKYHLRRVMGDMKLTFEAFTTILCEIEACLNSRPLCAMSVEPENEEILTPGHFLIGHSLKLLPSEDKTDIPINRLQRYELIQRVVQSFWKRWKNEYLTSLQQRPKWTKDKSSLEIGDLVLIKDDNAKPGEWARGRVMECHPGKDNVTRVVTLRTADGIVKRAANKLAKLPIE